MTLEEQFKADALELITEIFGPQELPSSNKPATFTTVTRTGYQGSAESSFPVDHLIRIEYTAEEFRNEKIQLNDVRFIGLASEFPHRPGTDNTFFVWDGVKYNVVIAQDVSNIIYDIQARPV